MSLKNYKEYSDISARLGEAIRKDRLSHAYIIEGDNLSQKEEYAIDIAKAVLCKAEPGIGCDQCIICRKIEHGNYQDLYIVESDNRSVKDKDVLQLQQGGMADQLVGGGIDACHFQDSLPSLNGTIIAFAWVIVNRSRPYRVLMADDRPGL